MNEVVEGLGLEISRGKMSKNIKLTVHLNNHEDMVRELCLFAEQQERSHKICSEIIHVVPKSNQMEMSEAPYYQSSTLAFVISLEKIYGCEDIIVVRIVLIEKWDQLVMTEYSWSPEARPQAGGTQFNSETLYLVKKSDGLYCRVHEYEILNTEIRT
jgi:hypothetical protein